jgi:hypothetical protein
LIRPLRRLKVSNSPVSVKISTASHLFCHVGPDLKENGASHYGRYPKKGSPKQFRGRALRTKLSGAEYAQCEKSAARRGQTLSEWTVKRLRQTRKTCSLEAENPKYTSIYGTDRPDSRAETSFARFRHFSDLPCRYSLEAAMVQRSNHKAYRFTVIKQGTSGDVLKALVLLAVKETDLIFGRARRKWRRITTCPRRKRSARSKAAQSAASTWPSSCRDS